MQLANHAVLGRFEVRSTDELQPHAGQRDICREPEEGNSGVSLSVGGAAKYTAVLNHGKCETG